ncbi:glycoside hydrolase family 26 protein [Dysgonomonas sp. 520]|uniref:glycoside hydrolase family 26 protein n=1 Tax=Dysgonomonas sp. 520 TaxID=2302931 RepID=UPI0013D7E4B0|nr:glycosyl hydrolase [Dysgonomonas sp. 520]NDW10173.1 endoglucanase [Dysgonomonas sp. 520]
MKRIFLVSILLSILFGCNEEKNRDKPARNISDKEASSSLQEFYTTLHARMNEGVMLGHQDALAYGNMWYGEAGRSDVKSVCGDYPAVVGWNLGKVEVNSALNTDSVPFAKIKEYVAKVNKMNGITTFNWSVANPAGKDITGKGVVASILPGNENHNTYISYLDHLANFFLELKDENGNYIPVIFRPFDSPATTDSWWNLRNNTADEYKELWKMTVDYLRSNKGIHHVLYAYSVYAPSSESDISEYYPGDEYVDVVGVNLYLDLNDDSDGSIFKKDLDKSLDVASKFSEKHSKITALTDTGLKGIKLSNFFSSIVEPVISKHKISYILFGRNAWNIEEYYHIPVPGHPASEDFAEFASSPRILTSGKLDRKS